ncbi:MAG: hypothetical protein LBS70_05070, partial [Candidatus Accumulibacter sp.]|nr:hypothetical protein [Accumulibacter sp.]
GEVRERWVSASLQPSLRPCHISGATRRKNLCLLSPDICLLKRARRSEEMAAIEEIPRHSGRDPESRNGFSGATRRKFSPFPLAGECGPKGRTKGRGLENSE